MDHVIDISNTGDLEALYNDKVDLKSLGTMSMTRASHIKFNDLTQSWDVIPVLIKNYQALPAEYRNWSSYEQAIEFEVAVFNEARRLDLLSVEGLISNAGVVIARKAYYEVTGEGSEGF